MEQLATPGSILLTAATLRLVEGLVRVNALGLVPVKGLAEPVEVFELVGASAIRRRLQAAVTRGLTRFVGRWAELAALRQCLERAGAGRGQVAMVVGEAGVGKSRLVYEFIHSHHTRNWLVLESASVSYGKATSYFPVVDLLKRYVRVEDGDDTRTIRAKVTGQVLTLDETLQEEIPALLALLDALPEDHPFRKLDPLQRRQRTLDALKRVLLRESQAQPVLLVCEDLHWIDAETQALLDALVERLPATQMLLLANYRPEYQHSWGRKTYYTQLRLDPFPPASAEELLQALLGDDASLAPLKQLLIERTEGNPFFLEESVRTLMETGVLVGDQGAYRLTRPLLTIQVPATVQAVLAARIDRLPPEEKYLLQTAAVIGNEISRALLQAIAELPEEALHRGLAHLQTAEFLYETSLFPELAYTFKHALTRDVARIAFYEHGSGDTTLVLTNPILYGLATFQPVLEKLCQEFRIITIDPRGTGASEPFQRPYTINDHMEDVRAIIETSWAEPVVGVGISRGGNLLVRLAVAYPALVQRLVLVGTPLAQQGRGTIDRAQEFLRHDDLEGAVRYWASIILTEPGLEPLVERFVKARLALPKETMLSFFDPDPEMDVVPLLGAVRVPTLVMHGTEDRNVPLEVGRYLAEHIPGARFYAFKGRGHVPIFTATGEFCDVLRCFVRTGSVPETGGSVP